MDPLSSPDANVGSTPDKGVKPKIKHRSAKASSLFHTPPPVDPERQSWLTENAEQESYGAPTALASKPTVSTEHAVAIPPSATAALSCAKDSFTSSAVDDIDSLERSSLNSSHAAAEKAASVLPQALSQDIYKFVSSLKTPHYKKPLQPSAVSLLYQTFYDEFNNKADEYLVQSTLNHGSVVPPESGSQNNSSTTSTNVPTTSTNTGNANSPQLGTSGTQTLDASIPSFTNGFNFRSAKREIRMETYEEIAEKRRERALRPFRLKEFNEIAEARATSLIYDRLFRPKVGTDLKRNEELTKRIEALRELPLSPELLDCGIEIIPEDEYEKQEQRDKEGLGDISKKKSKKLRISESKFHLALQPVADKFSEMDQQHTPFGKLDAFLQGHRMIVEDVISIMYPDTKFESAQTKTPTDTPNVDLSQTNSTAVSSSAATKNRARSNSGIGANFLKRKPSATLPTSSSSNSLSSQPQATQRSSSQTRRSSGTDSTSLHQQPNLNPHQPKKPLSVFSAVAADQLLPLLIYTFVHFDIPNLWLQFAFVMRYRNQSITALGEIAYSLTNWQAAIAFIEKTSLGSLGLGEKYKDLIEQTENEQAQGEKPTETEEDDDIIEQDPIARLVTQSPYTTDHDTFTDLPSTIPLTQHNSIRAHLRHNRITQLAASNSFNIHSITLGSNSGSNNADASNHVGSLVSDNAPIGGGPFATMMASADSRRASMISPNELVLSADQSIKSLGTTFGNNFRILMSKINAPKDQHDFNTTLHGNNQDSEGNSSGIFSSAFSNALMSTKTKSSSLTGSHANNEAEGNNVASPPIFPRRSSSSSSTSSRSNNSGTANGSGTALANSSTTVGSSAASTCSANSHSSDSGSSTENQGVTSGGPLLGRIVRSFRSNNDFKGSNSQQQQNNNHATAVNASSNGQYSALGSELLSFPVKDNESLSNDDTTPSESMNYFNNTSTSTPAGVNSGSGSNSNTATISASSPTTFSSTYFPSTNATLSSSCGSKLAPPADPTLASKDWKNLTVRDIEVLHHEYIRMVEYLKTNNAFC